MRPTRLAVVRPLLVAATLIAGPAYAQIRVNPTGVNVSTQTATTVFLTFGGLSGYAPAEALWCGAVVPATPALGSRCDPATIFGALPARLDLSGASGQNALTDIMSIPATVARRAFDAAEAGQSSEFFYVRRFVRTGFPDQYVAVTCRMSGSGARTPLSLVDVQLAFDVDTPVPQVARGGKLPALNASIVYTGSGRLQGRWEVVLPGEELPDATDRLSESALPVEQRGTQRQYAQLGTFNVFLDPVGRATVPGPDPRRLPTSADGSYFVLLRVEATDDREASSDLAAVGAGTGLLRAGGVAGFSLPALRYVVGTGNDALAAVPLPLGILQPADGLTVSRATPVDLTWNPTAGAAYLRVEIERDGQVVHEALLPPDARTYRLPSFVADRAGDRPVRWRVVAVFDSGQVGQRSAWRRLTFQ